MEEICFGKTLVADYEISSLLIFTKSLCLLITFTKFGGVWGLFRVA
jgi:hypothetical protein